MSTESIGFAKHVATLSPALILLLEKHQKDNFGELLPSLYLGDVTRHVIALALNESPEDTLSVRRELKTILDAMERGFSTGMPDVKELIAASFLENLPAKEEPGSEIRSMLGPELGRQLKKMT